jgi:hypothetical protein
MVHTLCYRDKMFLQDKGRALPVLKEDSILIAKGMYHTGLHKPLSPCPKGTFYHYSDIMLLQDRERVARVNLYGTYPLL